MFGDAREHERAVHSLGELVGRLVSLGRSVREENAEVDALLASAEFSTEELSRYLLLENKRYTRTLVHRGEDFELLLLCWAPHSVSPIHDHASQRCRVVLLHGQLEVRDFKVQTLDRSKGTATVVPDGEPQLLHKGDTDVRGDALSLHSVRNPTHRMAVSLHLYAGPIDACGVYDIKRQKVRTRLMKYDQVGPRVLRAHGTYSGNENAGDSAPSLPPTGMPAPSRPSLRERPIIEKPVAWGQTPEEMVEPEVLGAAPPTPPVAAPSTAASPQSHPGLLTRAWRLLPWNRRRADDANGASLRERGVGFWNGPWAREAKVPFENAQLAVKTLRHSYSNVEALRDVSLNVRSGDFVCLVGPSGCGKSTLLYALAGHIKPTGGTVSLDGKPVEGPGPDRLLMFQEPGLFPWLSVQGNILFALGSKGLPRKERHARTEHYLGLVGLKDFANARPHQLSGGMRMRVSLARALAMESEVLLMDEPFGSLDAQTREDMHRELGDIWRRTKKTIVFVTHDLREALTLSNRLVVMAPRPGRILRDLEIALPFPRDPDGAELASLARQIRKLFRDSAHEEMSHGGDGNESPAAVDVQSGLRARALDELESHLPIRPLAEVPLPGPPRRR